MCENDGDIITTGGTDRGYKLCKCCVCGTVEKCTPSFDYYTTQDHGDKLVCESCFRIYVSKKMKDNKPKE